MVSVEECRTSCDARARLEARCSEPSMEVTFGANITDAQRAKMKLLVDALKKSYPKFVKIAYRVGSVIQGSAKAYRQSLDGLGSAAQEVGLQAAACIVSAGTAVARALGQLDVSVTVTVSVSASVGASGGL